MITIQKRTLPEFGRSESLPAITIAEYESRLRAAVERMRLHGLDFLAVYGDREHFANLAFLTGFDPRFEEALLLLDAQGRRLLVVGNECMGYLPDPALQIETELFQEFSLMGQPRGNSRPFNDILSGFGIGQGSRVGCVGWKYFGGSLVGAPARALEIPSYIVDALRSLAGAPDLISNACSIFMDAQNGLRVINSADQIAQFEFAATRTSDSVLALIRHLKEGVAEQDLEQFLQGDGLPRNCHPMISFGEKAKRGLASPSANRAELGDAFTVAYGLNGALTCRAGAIAGGTEDLGDELKEFYPRFAANYFAVVATWLESLRLGVTAGTVFENVEAVRDASLYEFAVNPGHQIHLDEWVNAPFARGDVTKLSSGMALQADIIPVSAGPFCYINAEDGVVLADDALQAELAARHPEMFGRMLARRDFLREAIGLQIDESVLPVSNTIGWLAPYALAPEMMFVKA